MKKYLLQINLIIVFFVFLALPVIAQTNNLKSQFVAIREKTSWPFKGGSNADIISAFGPRNMYSEGRYDFHRGMDIDAEEGEKVRAVADGELFYMVNWEGAGNTVILKHEFSNPAYYHGKLVQYYYTEYMHLSGFKYTEADIGKKIKAGKVIGYAGQTGNASTPHLHLILKIGTWYELETQLAYPNSQYSSFGFDPAVNPLWLFKPEKRNIQLAVTQKLSTEQDGIVRCYFPKNQPMFNRAKLVITDNKTNKIIKIQNLNYNYRTGFDATTNDALDTPDITQMYIDPVGIGANYLTTNIILPKDTYGIYASTNYSRKLIVYDIWGRHKNISF